jgi:hypothetical protein
VSRAAGLAAAIALAGCGAESSEPAGVGGWDVTRTTLADASGRCDPTDLEDGRKGMWCYLQPALKVGEQAAAIDLYFGGTAPTAPVVEIQLQVKACRSEDFDTWMRTSFGNPSERKGNRGLWQNRYLLISADLPGSASRCIVRIFPRSEQAMFERVKRAP